MTKLPPDTTDHSVFPARNNCSPGFLRYTHLCFSTTRFILCTIQESYQGRRCLQGCLLPPFPFYSPQPSSPTCKSASSLWLWTWFHISKHNHYKTPRVWLFLPSSLSCKSTASPAMGLAIPFLEPICSLGLQNILWQWVPPFKHAGCREGLPPLCFILAAWYLHWVSVTVGALSE